LNVMAATGPLEQCTRAGGRSSPPPPPSGGSRQLVVPRVLRPFQDFDQGRRHCRGLVLEPNVQWISGPWWWRCCVNGISGGCWHAWSNSNHSSRRRRRPVRCRCRCRPRLHFDTFVSALTQTTLVHSVHVHAMFWTSLGPQQQSILLETLARWSELRHVTLMGSLQPTPLPSSTDHTDCQSIRMTLRDLTRLLQNARQLQSIVIGDDVLVEYQTCRHLSDFTEALSRHGSLTDFVWQAASFVRVETAYSNAIPSPTVTDTNSALDLLANRNFSNPTSQGEEDCWKISLPN
jgi:hypothetical protein